MFKKLLPLLAAVCLAAIPLFGQLGVGHIAGRVTDASGSVIPGAQIRVTNVDTNVTQESQTNSEGLYRVASLVGLAISLLGVSIAYQRFVFGRSPAEDQS